MTTFYLLSALLGGSLAASGLEMSKKQQFEEMFSGIPPEAIGLICNTLCDNTDSELLSAMTAMQHQLDEVNAKLNAVNRTLAGADMGPVRNEWKKKYPIFQASSPRGHYELSKTEAEQLCESQNAHLANFNQLQAAFNAGLDFCSCGWIAEGYAAYPIQFPRDGCSLETPPGIRSCHWQSTWNAWCIEGMYYS